MPGLPTGTVTFLFTDIEGSTTLLQRLGDGRYAEVLAEHRRLLRDAFAKGNGQEIDTQGDAFLVAFSRARDAVAAAVAAQRALTKHPWPDSTLLRVRMGLHTGEPVRESGGYVGVDVHRAARIAAAGHGGQILVSDVTHGLVARDLPEGLRLRDLGEHRLKDLASPHRLFQVVTADLPGDFPALRSLNAHPHNLPIQLTTFVGRVQAIAAVKTLLGTTRLVTLTGSGGAGKTRLALQVAADVVDGYPDGVWLAEFAPITDPALVPQTVASALNVPEQPGRGMAHTLVDALRPKALLLVLDNCEHLVGACRDLAVALLRTCPQVRLLATSREGLGVPGEILWRVPSLPVPQDIQHLPPAEELVLYDAVRLFADRATSTAPGFAVTSENAPAVVQVCQRLDGIPLAIELAAARVKVLSVAQIAARLDDRFRILTGGSQAVLPRQQTLRAAMDWSFDLLSDQERAVLRRLSVFAGGWTLEAAESVCAGDGVEASDILDLLTQLVDKSLVVAETGGNETRYLLLETVRLYGLNKLLEAGEPAHVRRRHRDWSLGLVEQAAPELRGPRQAEHLERLDREHDNLRAALEWSIRETHDAEAGVRLAAALSKFWNVYGHLTEGRRWLDRTLLQSGPVSPSARAKALYGAGVLAFKQSDYSRAKALFGESLTLFRELGDKQGVGWSLERLGAIAYLQDEPEQTTRLCEESLALFQELEDQAGMADSLDRLGRVAWRRADYEQARALCERSLAVSRDAGDTDGIASALNILGLIAMHEGDLQNAATLQEESLALHRQLAGKKAGTDSISILGLVAYYQGYYDNAATLCGEALARARDVGYKRGIAIQLHILGRVARAQGDHGRATTLHGEALTIFRELREKWFILSCMEGLAGVAVDLKQSERAGRLFAAIESLRESSVIPRPPVEQAAHDRDIATVRVELGDVAFAAAWAEGRAVPLEEAIEYALAAENGRETRSA